MEQEIKMYRESLLISASAPLPGGSTVGSHGVNRGGADGGRFCVETMRPLMGLSSSEFRRPLL